MRITVGMDMEIKRRAKETGRKNTQVVTDAVEFWFQKPELERLGEFLEVKQSIQQKAANAGSQLSDAAAEKVLRESAESRPSSIAALPIGSADGQGHRKSMRQTHQQPVLNPAPKRRAC